MPRRANDDGPDQGSGEESDEVFVSVDDLLGQAPDPRGYDPLADAIPEDEIRGKLRPTRV